ncbi:MAG: LysR family transcriptional regulator [Vicinamibacterales bacterium]
MDLRLLPTFVAVAECRHFGRAAALINLSQPAVSHQISQLEESIGTRLFNRDGRRVTLTVAGEALLEEARAILDAASRADARLRDVTSGAVGRVRIGASATAALYLLPATLRRYRASYPQFDCRLTIGPASELEDMVVRNELDLAVLAASRPQGELRAIELAADPFVLIMPFGFVPGRAEQRRTAAAESRRHPRLTAAMLAATDWIVREDGSDARRRALAWLERRRVAPSRITSVGGPAAVTEAVAAGLGMALTSRLAAAGAAAAGRLAIARAAGTLPARAFWLVDHPHKHHGAACKAMLAALNGLAASASDRPTDSHS